MDEKRTEEPGSCIGCEHYRIASNISGSEARCYAASRKGRCIDWQYGMNEEYCRKQLERRILNKPVPCWCTFRRQA